MVALGPALVVAVVGVLDVVVVVVVVKVVVVDAEPEVGSGAGPYSAMGC